MNNSIAEIYDFFHKRSDRPFGKSWEEWAIEWWRYVLSIPKSQNPGLDPDGKKFDIHKNPDNDVLFLVATYGGKAERNYTIPVGKSLFGPIMNYEIALAEKPQIRSEKELLNHVRQDVDDFKNKYFSINGTYLNYIDDYRVDSDVFDIHFVEDNVFNVPPGNTKAVCSGYYFFLKPLPTGSYDIRVGGSCSIGTTVVDVIWHLIIT